MPFTLSHPAAVLPLRAVSRAKLPFLALAIGSMMPDFGYFFAPCSYFRQDAHTIARSFTFCLPVGAAAITLVLALREGWVPLFPRSIQDWFLMATERPRIERPRARLGRVAWDGLSLILGAWTHVFWDAWTHRSGFFVQRIPALHLAPAESVEGFRILQHGSSVLGAAALGFAFLRAARLRGVSLKFGLSRRLYVWLIMAGAALAYAFAREAKNSFDFVTAAMGAFFLLFFGASVAIRVVWVRTQERQSS